MTSNPMAEQQPDNASTSTADNELEDALLAYEASIHCTNCNGTGAVLALGDWITCYWCKGEGYRVHDPVADTLITALEADNARLRAQLAAATGALETVTDEAVIALNNVWTNSGRDGINSWYLTHTRKAHENIAAILKRDKWDLLYEAIDRKQAATPLAGAANEEAR